ncbi:MAG: 2-C-methyl-D-erythritol 4-phosphate cytidylyltransferase [Rhodanobacteraceae bacterium]|nr:2-C-methyl-D-erythritol 4-phosphate cytidylyltransferase [Rhodanobacteraceae bacterium]
MTWVVVPAAGSGRRFGGELPKQYATIDGRPLLFWTLSRLALVPRISGLLVVLAADDPFWPGWDTIGGKPVITAIGGAERADSVLAGLRALPASVSADSFVLVHDAARPCVRIADIDALMNAVGDGDGGLLAAPVRDTIKRQQQAGAGQLDARVAQTVRRDDLWRALTPQMFRRGALSTALAAAGERGAAPTDEAQAMEWTGVAPLLVEGAPDNIKVTTAHDLALARFLLREQNT